MIAISGSDYMLQRALDGGFRPPEEARRIQAGLERIAEIVSQMRDGESREAAERFLAWYRMQGGAR